MKITFTTFILLLTLTSVSAQAYRPMIEPGKHWNYEYSWGNCGACVCYLEYGTYYFDNDTLINGLTYAKVYKNSINRACGFPDFNYIGSVYDGAMREAGHKVYYKAVGDSIERMHFDFDLSVGDTLPETYFFGGLNNDINNIVITSIDSILLGDSLWHKKFDATDGFYNYPTAVVEGIGSRFGGLFPYYRETLGLESEFHFNCYMQDEVVLFQVSEFRPCLSIWSDIQMPVEQPSSISISPNPSIQNVIIQIHIPVSNTVVQVYDYSGRMVRALPMNSNEIVLERNGLPAGLYWVRVLSENGLIGNGKVVFIGNP